MAGVQHRQGASAGRTMTRSARARILRGSRQSYIGGPVARHLLQGTAGDGFKSGGYLFPVGMDHKTDQDTLSYYRPLILQLPSDLNDTTAVTVSPVMLPEGDMPKWENLTVPTAGGSLTLDVHADLFWKVDLGAESLPTNTNIRLAAAGLRNVADASGLRIVQWDCEWEEKAQLAGRVPAQADAESFAVNGYLNGVVNLTQEGIGLGSCAIFGIAANGIENPIDQADLSGGTGEPAVHPQPATDKPDRPASGGHPNWQWNAVPQCHGLSSGGGRQSCAEDPGSGSASRAGDHEYPVPESEHEHGGDCPRESGRTKAEDAGHADDFVGGHQGRGAAGARIGRSGSSAGAGDGSDRSHDAGNDPSGEPDAG